MLLLYPVPLSIKEKMQKNLIPFNGLVQVDKVWILSL